MPDSKRGQAICGDGNGDLWLTTPGSSLTAEKLAGNPNKLENHLLFGMFVFPR